MLLFAFLSSLQTLFNTASIALQLSRSIVIVCFFSKETYSRNATCSTAQASGVFNLNMCKKIKCSTRRRKSKKTILSNFSPSHFLFFPPFLSLPPSSRIGVDTVDTILSQGSENSLVAGKRMRSGSFLLRRECFLRSVRLMLERGKGRTTHRCSSFSIFITQLFQEFSSLDSMSSSERVSQFFLSLK